MDKIRETARLKGIGSRMFRQAGAIALLAVTIGVLVNQMRSDRLTLVADWSPEARLTFKSGASVVISLEEARESFFSQKVVFLDARPPELYQEGHIQSARNLPWEAVEEYFDAVMTDIPQDSLIITYCDGVNCELSKDLALELFYRGYEKVRVLVTGWGLWKENQLPIITGHSPGA